MTFGLMDFFYLCTLAVVIDYCIGARVQENNTFFATSEHRTLVQVGLGLYLHLSLPSPSQMLPEDHLCNHLCRFHKRSSEVDGEEEVHDPEEALV